METASPLHTTRHKKILLKSCVMFWIATFDLLLLPASGDAVLRQSRSRDAAFLDHSQGWTVRIICKYSLGFSPGIKAIYPTNKACSTAGS